MEQNIEKILLIDTSSAFHRFYHGYNPITNLEGKEVHAIRGYIKFIKNLHDNFEFTHLVHVLDSTSLYRKTIDPTYKAQRPVEDPSMTYQKGLLQPMFNALDQKFVKKEDYEADDILATLAYKEAKKGNMVLIISQDKDLLQMVDNENVAIARFSKNENNESIYEYMNEETILEKYGVRSDQIADYLAIVGDSSDNIKGVHGAGPKAAAKLLAQYGSVETIIASAAQIEGKLGDKVRTSLEDLKKARHLTHLLKDVELPEISSLVNNGEKMTDFSFLNDREMDFVRPFLTSKNFKI